jgi:transposase-like protein
MSVLLAPHFHSEVAAYARLEEIIWPNGPVCPHCGGTERITPVKGGRIGLKRCGSCKGQFRATVGTVFAESKIPLHKWFQAAHMMASSKKGVSSHQLHRTLGVTYKTAWFMSHRLREAMAIRGPVPPLGGDGKVIESDETYIGRKDVDTDPAMKARRKGKPGTGGKSRVMTLVERDGGARSVHVDDLTNATMQRVLLDNADRKSRLITDEGTAPSIGLLFAKHDTVKHTADEYVRYVKYDDGSEFVVTTNTVEGFFSIFKRGMKGVYQHCSEKHLHRYLAEFDFRYSNRSRLGVNDEARTAKALRGIVGKRLTYRRPDNASGQTAS